MSSCGSMMEILYYAIQSLRERGDPTLVQRSYQVFVHLYRCISNLWDQRWMNRLLNRWMWVGFDEGHAPANFDHFRADPLTWTWTHLSQNSNRQIKWNTSKSWALRNINVNRRMQCRFDDNFLFTIYFRETLNTLQTYL